MTKGERRKRAKQFMAIGKYSLAKISGRSGHKYQGFLCDAIGALYTNEMGELRFILSQFAPSLERLSSHNWFGVEYKQARVLLCLFIAEFLESENFPV